MRQPPFSQGSPAPKRMRSGMLLIVIIGVMILFSVLVTFLSDDSDSTQLEATIPTKVFEQIPTETPSPTAKPAPTAEAPSTAADNTSNRLTYQEVQTAYETLSTTDWIVYARSLVNRRIQWEGQLMAAHAVDELWFTMDTSIQHEIPHIALHLARPGSTISPGETAIFGGEISRIVVFDRQVLVHVINGQVMTAQN
ncbi:MAG: hypothetical protein ACYCZF_13945 [Anaerolineae bacterium]